MDATSGGQSPRDRILSVARRIIAERGLAKLSVQAVATEAGVTKSPISCQFGSRDGLIRAILESMAVKQGDEATKAIGRMEDPAERFSAFMVIEVRVEVGRHGSGRVLRTARAVDGAGL